ncbi:MAG: amidase [Minwuia sp.]|nr:amidase [Minwuia sp.]
MSAPASGAGVEGFIERLDRAPTGTGPLDGLTFGLKDLYDVAGRTAGCGNPDWRRTHAAADGDCSVLARLLAAGACLTGITHTDELAYSLNGENVHYGTPVNPAGPGRIPGGSSSGSASVTAAGLVDFAIGSDTGGSVRIPATYCGLYGIRTTFGTIALDRCMALAPSFDTCGWFARDTATLARVGAVLLDQPVALARPKRLVMDPALFAMCDVATAETLSAMIDGLDTPVEQVDIGFDPELFKEAFRILQAREIWDVHGAWVTEVKPHFGPGVVDRFRMAAGIRDAEVAAMQPVRDRVRETLDRVLADDTVLLLPTAPGPAPVVNWDAELLDAFRYRVIALTCLAGHAGLPQISVPAGMVDGAPVGLSLMGARGTDAALLGTIQALGI